MEGTDLPLRTLPFCSRGNFKIIILTNLMKWTQMKCEWGTQEIYNNSLVSEVCKETTSVD